MKGKARVAIVGFGRTGRQAFKAIWLHCQDLLELAAVGVAEPTDAPAAAHLLQYDSNYGRFAPSVSIEDGCLRVNGARIPVVSAASTEELPWRAMGVDIVVDATGAAPEGWRLRGHLDAGAAKVIVTAACDDADLTLVFGVNDEDYEPHRHHLMATESGTANALTVLMKALTERCAITAALMTAVRAYDASQKLIDTTDIDLRRARAAPMSIVPTTTRAAQAVETVLPALAGRVGGYAVHVPVPTVSMLELTLQLASPMSAAEVNEALREAAAGPLGRVLGIADAPLVSSDYIGDSHSAVIDLPATVAIGPLVKVGAWYDNEWGYSCRVADTAAMIARSMP